MVEICRDMVIMSARKALPRVMPKGLYCPRGEFYIDPLGPVARAVITHGHADHARGGSRCYLSADAEPTSITG
jgi:putative mRNA 3-end processing factor